MLAYGHDFYPILEQCDSNEEQFFDTLQALHDVRILTVERTDIDL